MVLNDLLKNMDPDQVVYIGCKGTGRASNGSGFVYIGHARTAPADLLGEREVIDHYPHDTDVPGYTVIVYGAERGKYWFWHEAHPEDEYHEKLLSGNMEPFEDLLMGIVKLCIQDYKKVVFSKLYKLKKRKNPVDDEIEEAIARARITADLEFLTESGMGEYILNRVDDEIRIINKYPKVKNMDYDKRHEFMKKKRRELIANRAKREAVDKYAAIKGRSVNHDLDG